MGGCSTRGAHIQLRLHQDRRPFRGGGAAEGRNRNRPGRKQHDIHRYDQGRGGIDFAQGSIKARRDSVSDGAVKTLQIKSGETTVSIEKSDISLSQESGRDLSLTVNRGDATVDTGGEKQTVKEDQKVIASKDEIKVFELAIKLLKPEPRAHIPLNQPGKPVIFSWEDVKGPYDLTLELSQDLNFEQGMRKIRVSGASFTTPLPAGNYYWRITAVQRSSQKMEISEVRRFSVIRDDPIDIIAPENNAQYYYRAENPLIQFKWNESDMVSGYRHIIARDRDMKDIVATTEVSGLSLALDNLGRGAYFWRLEKIPAAEGLDLRATSAVQRLLVEKRNQVDPPQLISPQDKKRINRSIAQKNDIAFSWKKGREIQKTRIEISRDPEFNSILNASETENNFIKLAGDFTIGSYYWRASGLLGDGERTALSRPFIFEIIKSEEVVLANPPDGETVALQEDQSAADIGFAWNRIEIDGSFLLEIARDSSFTDQYRQKTLTDFYHLEKGMKPGRYFWRVALQDADTVEIMKSPARSFIVLPALTAPVAISPADGSTVDMADKDRLSFSWKPLRGASHYSFVLYQNTGGTLQWITSIDTAETGCFVGDLKKLDVGSFQWTLQALDRESPSGRVIRKSTLIKNNFKIKLGDGDSTLKIKVPGVIYIQ
jgi:hypothetical protein